MRKVTQYKIIEAKSSDDLEHKINVFSGRWGWKLESIAIDPRYGGIGWQTCLMAVLSKEVELNEEDTAT